MNGAQIHLEDLKGLIIPISLFILLVFWRDVRDGLRPAVKYFFPYLRPDMSSADEWGEDENDVAALPTTTATTQQQWIATPQNDSNALLFQQQVEDLAKMVKAGAVGETKGLHIIFGVKPSSSNPRYLAARDALKAELAKMDGPQFVQPDGTLAPPTYPMSGRHARTRAR